MEAIAGTTSTEPGDAAPCLDVRELRVHFPVRRGPFGKASALVKAVDGVNLRVGDGETVGLVGESGCGKSTLGRSILRVFRPDAGIIAYRPRGGAGATVDLAALNEAELRRYRLEIRMIFQDPHTALNPRMSVLDIVAQPLDANGLARGREREDRVADMMQRVGLRPEYRSRYPHEFSGGERQRIVIARALVVRPKLVIADEAVSALDVSVRAQTLNLLQDLQEEFSLTYLFVSHDLSVVKHISDHVAVMYVGRVVEFAATETLFHAPRHPYTEALLSAIPVPNPERRGRGNRIRLPGDVADPSNAPSGCPFHPRCGYATDICSRDAPAMRPVGGSVVACHHADRLALRGVEA